MKPLVLLSLLSLFANLGPQKDDIQVYFFLGEECLISQYYTLTIRNLWQYYADERVTFVGLFPNPSSSPDKMASFKAKYQLSFQLLLDEQQQKMNTFGVQVTPEVVVYNKSKERILYQGRIDNTYFRVGKRRSVTTTSELEDVLKAIHSGSPIAVQTTQPVGCFITKLNPLLPNAPMCKPVSNR